jgi:hypothetical protein
MKGPSPADKAGKPDVNHVSWQQALSERVAASAAFQKSNRLRDLLLFLCERAAADPAAGVREQEIGVKVFGRPADYDTTQDPLVRVQVSQLRKRLQLHFEQDGKHEPVVIEIPKGCYTPVFRDRAIPAHGDWGQRLRAWFNPLAIALAILATFTSLAAVWFAYRPVSSNLAQAPRREPQRDLDLFWRQVFGSGRPACVVLSDSSLASFEILLGRRLTANDYRRGLNLYHALADAEIASPDRRAASKVIVDKATVPFADAQLVSEIASLNAFHGVHTDLVFARDFSPSYFNSHDVILLGNAAANPWQDFFEDQLNFRARFQGSPERANFENLAPLPGEEAIYTEDRGRHLEYCRVAFLPNPARKGSVILIAGTDMTSTQAGGQLITSDRWIDSIHKRLGDPDASRLPYFEVLLKVQVQIGRNCRFEVVAHRVARPQP